MVVFQNHRNYRTETDQCPMDCLISDRAIVAGSVTPSESGSSYRGSGRTHLISIFKVNLESDSDGRVYCALLILTTRISMRSSTSLQRTCNDTVPP